MFSNVGVTDIVPLNEYTLESRIRVLTVTLMGLFLGMRNLSFSCRSARPNSAVLLGPVDPEGLRSGPLVYRKCRGDMRILSFIIASYLHPWAHAY
jgi:hypothetical protein